MTTSARIIIHLLALSCATSLVACGDDGPTTSTEPDASSGSGGVTGMSGNGGMNPVLDPPPSIDLESCSHILRAEVTDGSSCVACCQNAGFDTCGFPYLQGCVCGPAAPRETEICADRNDSREVCTACCNDASYQYGILSNGMPCECGILMDPEVCADISESDDRCITCCLNNGFLIHSEGSSPCICSM